MIDLARVAADDRGAEDAVAALRHVDLDEALLLAVGRGAVHLREGRRVGVELDARAARRRARRGRRARLRVGVGAPRHHEGRELAAADEERVLHDDLRRGVGGVGELPGHADVARRVDARVGRAQPVVDPDAAPRRRTATPAASSPRPSTLGARPGADQDLVDRDRARRGRRRASRGASFAAPRRLDALEACSRARARRRPARARAARSRRRRRPRARGVRRPARAACTRDAEALEGLRELAADRAAADHARAARGRSVSAKTVSFVR